MIKRIGIFGALVLVMVLAGVATVDAQTKKRKPAAKKVATVTQAPPASQPVVEAPTAKPEPKKNERPASTDIDSPSNGSAARSSTGTSYYYEFRHPEFEVNKIVIEHDDSGRGTIKFTKKMFGDTVSDPLQVSPGALERINAAYAALNFIDSRDTYQYEKDYSHLGTATFTLKRSGKERTTTFNYTTNKDAKTLADEYRKLGNQFLWVFDITVARENQPLESPRLLDSLDGLYRRNEISDPAQMVPLLNELSEDERIPLIARNHAKKLSERIGKGKK